MSGTTEGSIYFLIRGERIKVGFSIDVRRRLANFQHDEGDLLGRIDGVTMADERAAHKYLGRWHIRGEWFSATADCLDAVQELIDGELREYSDAVTSTKAAERVLVSRIAAHTSWANTPDRAARTSPARRALDEKFIREAGGDLARAENLRKAHYHRMALKSVQARRAKRGVTR